jgi:hypothetical protein
VRRTNLTAFVSATARTIKRSGTQMPTKTIADRDGRAVDSARDDAEGDQRE